MNITTQVKVMMQSFRRYALLILLICLSGSVRAAQAASPRLLVFAASSLTNVLDEIGSAYTVESGHPVMFSYGATAVFMSIESRA